MIRIVKYHKIVQIRIVKYPLSFDHKYCYKVRIFTTSCSYCLKSFDLMFLLADLDDPFSGGGWDSPNGARKTLSFFLSIVLYFR